MPAYNFQKRFAPAVERGEKRQTIRAQGKRRHARPGERLALYTGQRTTSCRKLGMGICTAVRPLSIDEAGIFVDGLPLSDAEAAALARADGFKDFVEMREWFRETHEGLPFSGVLIQWTPEGKA